MPKQVDLCPVCKSTAMYKGKYELVWHLCRRSIVVKLWFQRVASQGTAHKGAKILEVKSTSMMQQKI